MMRASGNFDGIGALSARLDRLAREGMRDIEHRAAVAVDLQIERQFASGESAEGERWADKVDGNRSFLQKTTKMRRSKRVTGVRGVEVRIDRPAGFHQSGTKRMAARPIAPTGEALPEGWAKPIEAAAREVFAEVGGG